MVNHEQFTFFIICRFGLRGTRVCVCVYALFSTDFSFHLLHHPIPFLLNFCVCFFAVESDSMYKYVHAKAERKKNDGSLAV